MSNHDSFHLCYCSVPYIDDGLGIPRRCLREKKKYNILPLQCVCVLWSVPLPTRRREGFNYIQLFTYFLAVLFWGFYLWRLFRVCVRVKRKGKPVCKFWLFDGFYHTLLCISLCMCACASVWLLVFIFILSLALWPLRFGFWTLVSWWGGHIYK